VVVGVGGLGQACAFALMLRGSAREIVLAYANNARPRVRGRVVADAGG
jgi:malate/lactate dehydrogenase